MRIENSFEVPAAPDTAWALLTDVPRVVPCMPGAELERIVDESTWEVLQRVKLGPISLQFRSEVTRTEMNETDRRTVLSVNAKEMRGRGGAEATIESSLDPVEGGLESRSSPSSRSGAQLPNMAGPRSAVSPRS